eukprot:1109581-Alexandrium_andersonii.AAC.1
MNTMLRSMSRGTRRSRLLRRQLMACQTPCPASPRCSLDGCLTVAVAASFDNVMMAQHSYTRTDAALSA